MSAPETTAPLADRPLAELELIGANVAGVYGIVVATSDGFLVAHDVPDLESTEIAALAATTRALATRTTLAAGVVSSRRSVQDSVPPLPRRRPSGRYD